MTNIMPIVILVGLMGGIAIGLQAPLATMISHRLGVWESVFIVHLGGLLVVSIPLVFLGGGRLGHWQSVPWYALAGSTLGVAVISSTVYMVPRVGVAAAIMLIITGQLIIASTIDHFGVFEVEMKPFTLQRLLGLCIVAFGVWHTLRN